MPFSLHSLVPDCAAHRGRLILPLTGYALVTALALLYFAVLARTRLLPFYPPLPTASHCLAFREACGEGCIMPVREAGHEDFSINGFPVRTLDPAQLPALANLPGIAELSPALFFRLKAPEGQGSVMLCGVDPAAGASVAANCYSPADLVAGRVLAPGDRGKVLLNARYAARAHLGVGERLRTVLGDFTIVGLVQVGAKPGRADLYLPLAEAQPLIKARTWEPLDGLYNGVLVQLMPTASLPTVVATLQKHLPLTVFLATYQAKPAPRAFGLPLAYAWSLLAGLGLVALGLAFRAQGAWVQAYRQGAGDQCSMRLAGWLWGQALCLGALGGVAGVLLAHGMLFLLPIKRLAGLESVVLLTLAPSDQVVAVLASVGAGVLVGLLGAARTLRRPPIISVTAR